jgi:hypothetical protein
MVIFVIHLFYSDKALVIALEALLRYIWFKGVDNEAVNSG